MKNIIVVDGYYGSGKTTFCKKFLLEHDDYEYIGIDSLCSRLKGDQKAIENEVLNLIDKSDSNIIIDFYFKTQWKPLFKRIGEIENANVKYIIMDTSIEESYRRFKNRSLYNKNVSYDDYVRRLQ